jgi:hypothetical protein
VSAAVHDELRSKGGEGERHDAFEVRTGGFYRSPFPAVLVH